MDESLATQPEIEIVVDESDFIEIDMDEELIIEDLDVAPAPILSH